MNDFSSPHSPDPKPINTWEPPEHLEERRPVRVTVHSAMRFIGAEEDPTDGSKGRESAERFQYAVDGELLLFNDRAFLRYPEHADTGFQNAMTHFVWFHHDPQAMELARVGENRFYLHLSENEPVQTLVYQLPFGSFESQVNLIRLRNRLDAREGTLSLAYQISLPGGSAQYIELHLHVRPLRESEMRTEYTSATPSEEQINSMIKDFAVIRERMRGHVPSERSIKDQIIDAMGAIDERFVEDEEDGDE